MGLMSKFKALFSDKARLDSVELEDIRKERIRLEQVEKRISKEATELEDQKQELFEQGKEETSQRRQVSLARKIKGIDAEAQVKDRQLAMLSRQMRVLSGLVMLKENQTLVENLGVSSIVSKMDIEDLKKFVERSTVEGKFQMERFAQILKTMEAPDLAEMEAEEADVLGIVAAMQEVKATETENPEAAQASEEKKLDDILRTAQEPAGDETDDT